MAGKRPRIRASNEAYKVNLFSANTTFGWRVVRRVPVERACEQLALKKWREIWSEEVNGKREFLGVQPLSPEKSWNRPIPALAGSPPTITLTEMRMNAGLFGRSRTMGMPEWKRLKRQAKYDEKKILAPEDAIERAIEKVKLWPYPASRVDDGSGEPVFGDRATRVYPHAK